MTYRYSSYLKGLNIGVDFLLLNLSFYLAYASTFEHWIVKHSREFNPLHMLTINLIWYLVTGICKLYVNVFSKESIPTIKVTLKSVIVFGLCMLLLTDGIKEYTLSHRILVTGLIFFTVLIFNWKLFFLLQRIPHKNRLIEYKPVVIAGASKNGIELYNYLSKNSRLGYQVVGFFEDRITVNKKGVTIIGKLDECVSFARRRNVEEIFCALPESENEKINQLMLDADKHLIRFKLVPDVKDYFRKNVMVELYGHLPVLSPRSEPLESKGNQILKRAFDIVFSLFVIVFILSWLYPILSMLIKLESKGPALFQQIRSGKNNKPFYCLKFRSMTVNNDANRKQATKNDARITKIGRFLRKSSMDELPQFINVLKGNMSVVGPRPHMLKHTKEYSEIIDKFMVRHFLTPGITGWAQVNGLRGETQTHEDMENRVEADIWYLENWSLLLDCKIIFMTVYKSIFGDKNAY
ncbi:undecaprenyl-phosphate glucose phosphotransferase [Solitalea lacus]|uniref:undecaprenyl-phosphate glucose phosphotransferase n=1 Tax=Solitalea lacus TaxID=2911172 RepID=UPI001EDAC30B|nr:undecaprenyl-phosphate glucose phosphotransferase [Solitalea lacus]UKJ07086.1 undecaprenyl-phosphate glucose phosphotransferase [Solitalea lacus]